jgi:hypothetical protein
MSVVDGEESRVDFAGIDALLSRSAGYSVATECLRVQSAAEDLDPSLRTANKVTLAPEAWSWYTGAIGEIAVGKILAALGPAWFVRHAVPIRTGTKDVDHLVIGPGGVFAINTKHHAGASIWIGDHVIRVNRSNTGHLRDAVRDRDDVARRLAEKTRFDVPVTAVLALFDPGSIKDGSDPAKTARDGREWLNFAFASFRDNQSCPLGLPGKRTKKPTSPVFRLLSRRAVGA